MGDVAKIAVSALGSRDRGSLDLRGSRGDPNIGNLAAVTSEAQRVTMEHAMDALVNHRSHVGYLQRRPMSTSHIASLASLLHALEHGIAIDCSESVTLICHVAGLSDPSGFHFDGSGNTQSMFDHLKHYTDPRLALPGALCFLGAPGRLSTQHVCMVRHSGTDPTLFSHGGNGAYAAHYIRYSVERRYHVGAPVFLSIAGLG